MVIDADELRVFYSLAPIRSVLLQSLETILALSFSQKRTQGFATQGKRTPFFPKSSGRRGRLPYRGLSRHPRSAGILPATRSQSFQRSMRLPCFAAALETVTPLGDQQIDPGQRSNPKG